VPQGPERMMGYGCFEDVVNVLEEAVSQSEYLVGDRFTAADLYVGSGIGFGMQFGTVEKRPAFEHYWRRLTPVRRRCVRRRSTTHWRQSKPNCQLLRPKRDELNGLDFDTSRHYPRLCLFHGREVD